MHYCLNRLYIIYLLSSELCSGACSLMSEYIYVFAVIRGLFRSLCISVWLPGDLLFILLEHLCIRLSEVIWKYYCSPIVYCYSVVSWITDHFVGLSPDSSHTGYEWLRHFVYEYCSKVNEKWVAGGPDMGKANRRKRVLVDDCEMRNVIAWHVWRDSERITGLKTRCL
jgi:hypothetical protein